MEGSRPRIDFHALAGGPWGTFVYGSPRSVVDRIAFAMATANDPNPTWVDIRDPGGGTDPAAPGELGWIPQDRLYLVSSTDARPRDTAANLALWSVVRSDEPTAVLGPLTDFLRLPSTVQIAVSHMGTEPSRPALVVANSDRVRPYYPRDPSGVRPIIDAILHAGVLPIFAAVGPPGEGRAAFDFVFEVYAPDPAHWRSGSLTCHKAPPQTKLPLEQSVPLAALPRAVEVLERPSSRRGGAPTPGSGPG
jgi:hypothetical protein